MNILAQTFPDFSASVKMQHGTGSAAALYRNFFKNGTVPEALPDLQLPDCKIVAQEDADVLKFASRLADGTIIESVIIPGKGRTTLCVSSQVGCRMGCAFCATGVGGFVRNCTAEEIVWQAFAARFELRHAIDNIVFMGMGEPLDNFDNVIQAVRVLCDQRGLNIPQSRITISTAGHVEGINRLAAPGMPKVRLALSLNAPTDAVRSEIMPLNRKYPLRALRKALQSFPLGKGGLFFVEYVLIAGVNDSVEMAASLAEFLAGLPVRVNLIACNGNDSLPFGPPEMDQVKRFRDRLVREKLFVRVRQSQGLGIRAACGQLRASLRA
jgi:23S rRNA (adenine2503-C2)-methyltransferase